MTNVHSSRTNIEHDNKIPCNTCEHVTDFGPHIPVEDGSKIMLPLQVKHKDGKRPCCNCSFGKKRQSIIDRHTARLAQKVA